MLREAGHDRCVVGADAQLERGRALDEQIANLFVVDLEVGDEDGEDGFVSSFLDASEEILQRLRHNAGHAGVADHGVRFTRSSRSVGEDRGVETGHDAIYQMLNSRAREEEMNTHGGKR